MVYVTGVNWLSIINLGIFAWLCAGISLRKRHLLHAGMMTLAFAWDVALLLYVELSRKAIEQTLEKPPGAILVIHIALATITLVLYPFVIYSGGKLMAGGNRMRHRWLAIPFMVARGLVVVTAWMVAS